MKTKKDNQRITVTDKIKTEIQSSKPRSAIDSSQKVCTESLKDKCRYRN